MPRIGLLLLPIILVLSLHSAAKVSPIAVQGTIDLREWNFAADGPVSLTGEWEFYWHELVDPRSFENDTGHEPRFIQVPGSWLRYRTDDGRAGADGYTTYRLRVYKDKDADLALRIPYAQTAYQLWINGELTASSGVVGTSPHAEVPSYDMTISPLPPGSEVVDIVIHVSNYHFREGGLLRHIYVDNTDRTILRAQRGYAVGAALFGSSLIIALYHLFLFLWQRDRRSYLYLALLAFLVAVRTLVTGSQLIQVLLPDMPWTVQIRLEYLTSYLVPLCFLYFFQFLFPRETSPLVTKGWTVISIIGVSATILTPPRFSSQLIPYCLPLAALLITYLFGMTILAAMRKREGANLLLTGAAIFFLFSSLSILYYRGYLITYDLVPHGFFFFLLSQALLLAKRASDAFRREQTLAQENAWLLLQTKEQLRQLRRFRQEMVEREVRVRERIADILHGRTQARLLMASAKAAKARRLLHKEAAQAEALLDELKQTIDQVRDEDIRKVSHTLHPATVEAGLIPALSTLLKHYDEVYDLDWHVSREAEELDDLLHGALSHPMRFRIYRIAEEALNNVARHASADTIWISLTVEPRNGSHSPLMAISISSTEDVPAVYGESSEELVLIIRDNGTGIRQKDYKPGYGLQAIAALVEDLNGTYSLQSEFGRGSVLEVRIPVSRRNGERGPVTQGQSPPHRNRR